MTTSTSVCGKASVFGGLRGALQVRTKCHVTSRNYSGNGGSADRQEDRAAQRELLVNVLGANATKRDAKQYLARFRSPNEKAREPPARVTASDEAQHRLDRLGINLGGLYAPARAIADSPQFVQGKHADEQRRFSEESPLHIALVCLRAPDAIEDDMLDALAVTLSQLVKLDMRIVLVLDCHPNTGPPQTGDVHQPSDVRRAFVEQCDRLRRAICRHNPAGARSILGAMEVAEDGHGRYQKIEITMPSLILDPLKRGTITMLPPLAYTTSGQLRIVRTEDVMSGTLRKLSGIEAHVGDDASAMNTSVDRIIILDQLGGIPSRARGDEAHVFVNLEQEYDDIRSELIDYSASAQESPQQCAAYRQHQNNLDIAQRCLSLLPPASSALIIAPTEAASASLHPHDSSLGAGTRRQKNTLIHNLLTNKPLVSSSLPVARLGATSGEDKDPNHLTSAAATLIRRGMPLTIIPGVDRSHGWLPPVSGETTLQPDNDPRVDLSRLVHLVDSSFRRKLDVPRYLARIRGRLAGIIVAGEYEGAAILTWEMPAGATATDPTRLVPYLDKFAVHPSSQGSSGVADIVFQAMLRTCFPRGVCWRSRKTNPANKWYFERAVGSWQIPDSDWTMFWTGEGVVTGTQRWRDYVSVCRSITPTWADGKTAD